jgi:hypothetical protein
MTYLVQNPLHDSKPRYLIYVLGITSPHHYSLR